MRQVGAVRVGIFGLVTSSAASLAANHGLEVENALTAAAAVVAQLRGPEKADVVILISHCGESEDKRVARQVPGIDVIVGSHSHTRLPQGEMVWSSDELKPDEVNGTVIVQAGQWGGELGRLDLLLQKNDAGEWRVSRYQAQLLPVTSETPEDPAVNTVLDRRDTKRRWSDVVIDAIRKARTITPAYDGRRIVVETPRSAGRVQ